MITNWILIGVGTFIVVFMVIFNIGMNGYRVQNMVRLIGVVGTKIVYAIIGIAMIVLGILFNLGII